jgi:hypothetical protein
MTIKDEASGFRRVFFLQDKSTVSSILKTFFADAEKETGRKAKSIRTENGTEYINGDVVQLDEVFP